ncbi:MAG: alpha/beta hydrolase [Granulosicoccaceae bacterium]
MSKRLIQCAQVIALSIACTATAYANEAYQQQITLSRPTAGAAPTKQCVVLLHGLARTASSMNSLADYLVNNNYIVANIDYPSRQFPISELAENTVPAGIQACLAAGASEVSFVTHSLGGIMLRYYAEQKTELDIHRAVLLGPPNHGSEVVDNMRDVPGYKWLNGPAGQQLGTDNASVPSSLGAVNFDTAVVAGTFSINLVLSTYLPDPDDGKVSVESSKVDNMCAHLQMDVSHPYLMKDDDIIAEVLNYLKDGRFESTAAEYPDCSFR